MPQSDPAVSEIVSVILILAVIIAGLAIFAAVALPQLEKENAIQTQTKAVETISNLKTGIDQLWLFDKPQTTASVIAPAGSYTTDTKTKILFNHSGVQKTTSLLTLKTQSLTYEGGAVFFEHTTLLPHSGRENHAVLICSNEEQTLTANTPITISYTYNDAETYAGISDLQIISPNNYWQKLQGIDTLTLIDCTIILEAVT